MGLGEGRADNDNLRFFCSIHDCCIDVVGCGGNQVALKFTIVYDVGDSPPGIPTLLKYL